MDSRASLASQESKTQVKMTSRKRPLHTCAVSVLVIANKASNIVQGINGPLGTLVKVAAKFATFASPIFVLFQYQWIILTFLSVVDRIILAVEYIIERLYPPAGIIFNKIDAIVQVIEIIPEKLDQAMNNVPSSASITSVHQGPVWDWGLLHAITILNFVSTRLTGYRMSTKGAREKEILVDTSGKIKSNNRFTIHEADAAKANGDAEEQLISKSSKGHHHHHKSNEEAYAAKETGATDVKGGEANNTNVKSSDAALGASPLGAALKGSYKEALTKGRRGNKSRTNSMESYAEYKDYNNKEEEKFGAADEVNNGGGNDEIMNLFDSAWLTNRRTNFEANAPRSLSFHGGY